MINEIKLDLSGEEMMVVLVLATLGECVMAGDVEASKRVFQFLNDVENGPELAKAAMDKLHAAMNLTASMTPGSLS